MADVRHKPWTAFLVARRWFPLAAPLGLGIVLIHVLHTEPLVECVRVGRFSAGLCGGTHQKKEGHRRDARGFA